MITKKQYDKLSPEEQRNYRVSKWSKYKNVKKKNYCDSCGHYINSRIVTVPTKNAQPLEYEVKPFLDHLWEKQAQQYLKNITINLDIPSDKSKS